MIDYFKQLYDYHYWATGIVLQVTEQLTPEQLSQSRQEFGWGSVQGILTHTYNAEWIWLRRWQGDSPAAFPEMDAPFQVAELRRRWSIQEGELRAFLGSQTQESLQRQVFYTTTRGQAHHQPLTGLLAHVVNHASEHRAELAAIFTQLGIPHRETEMNQYFIEQTGNG